MTQVFGKNLPESWSVARLKHVTSFLNRGSAPNYVDYGPVRVIGQSANQADELDWSRTRFHDHSGDPSKLKGYLYPADILINSTGTGTLGRVGYFKMDPEGLPCTADSHITIARTICERLEPRFAYYWLSSSIFQEYINSALVVGATNQIELNRDRLADAPVPLPPRVEQQRIADYLNSAIGKIDNIGATTRKQMDLLRERRRAFVEEHIISRPTDLGTVRIRSIMQPSFDAGRSDLRVLSVYRDYGVIPKESRQDNFNKTPEDTSRYLVVRPGDIVVNKMKAWQGSLGVSVHDGIVSPDYLVARSSMNIFDSRYLHYLLRSPRMVAEYSIRSKGIRPAQWRLYWEDFSNIKIPRASKNDQAAAVLALQREDALIEKMLSAMQRRISGLSERRQTLITAAITGQFDVSSASGLGIEG